MTKLEVASLGVRSFFLPEGGWHCLVGFGNACGCQCDVHNDLKLTARTSRSGQTGLRRAKSRCNPATV